MYVEKELGEKPSSCFLINALFYNFYSLYLKNGNNVKMKNKTPLPINIPAGPVPQNAPITNVAKTYKMIEPNQTNDACTELE